MSGYQGARERRPVALCEVSSCDQEASEGVGVQSADDGQWQLVLYCSRHAADTLRKLAAGGHR